MCIHSLFIYSSPPRSSFLYVFVYGYLSIQAWNSVFVVFAWRAHADRESSPFCRVYVDTVGSRVRSIRGQLPGRNGLALDGMHDSGCASFVIVFVLLHCLLHTFKGFPPNMSCNRSKSGAGVVLYGLGWVRCTETLS